METLLFYFFPQYTQRVALYECSPFKPAPISVRRLEREKGVGAQNSPRHIGQAMHHAKFGEGVIVNIGGSDSDMRVQVNFRTAGTKWLALEYTSSLHYNYDQIYLHLYRRHGPSQPRGWATYTPFKLSFQSYEIHRRLQIGSFRPSTAWMKSQSFCTPSLLSRIC